jgi:DNA-binding NtrC family response regulator
MADKRGKVLIVDKDKAVRSQCRHYLESGGFTTVSEESERQALERIRHESFDVALLDLRNPGFRGMEALGRFKQESPNTAVIVMARHASIDSAVEAVKLGAFDYVSKPFTSEALLARVERAAQAVMHALENACIGRELQRKMLSDILVGRSEAMNRVLRLIQKAAPVDSTVLITGETGVGKEVVARAVHRLSRRSGRPFVTVDCGTLVESLFESELFGHVKGAFTGAVENAMGKIELAAGGTLFLDEIANISTQMQAKLLRAVEEREISPVGGSVRKKIDVRIISATNRNLYEEVCEGKFREDLFYRLNVIHIAVPPLRERIEDIPAIAQHYLKKLSADRNRSVAALSEQAVRFLKRREWPGNVRELIHAIEYAIVTCERRTIGPEDLPLEATGARRTAATAGGSLARLEQSEILSTLDQFRGNKTRAAEYLGINRKTLREKLRKYGLPDKKTRGK